MERRVTDETVEYLRRSGASKDLIDFADRHAARFSQADVDRAWSRALWMGVLVAVIVVATGVLLLERLA